MNQGTERASIIKVDSKLDFDTYNRFSEKDAEKCGGKHGLAS